MPTLYYGDNLGVMREHLKDASVDLIYMSQEGRLPDDALESTDWHRMLSVPV